MGYTTDFSGSLKLSKKATPEQIKYINTFSGTRRMMRSAIKLEKKYKGEHGFNGKYGIYGGYFAIDDSNMGQSDDGTIVDYNAPPEKQLSLWCQWVLTDDGAELVWDGGERFYGYVEWLQYLIDHFFSVWNIKLSGEIHWTGEDSGDMGKIIVKNNVVKTKTAVITYK